MIVSGKNASRIPVTWKNDKFDEAEALYEILFSDDNSFIDPTAGSPEINVFMADNTKVTSEVSVCEITGRVFPTTPAYN